MFPAAVYLPCLRILSFDVFLVAPTHPKAFIEEAVDDRVNEAVGHGEPVNAVEDGYEELLLLRSLVNDQFRVEVYEQEEDVDGQPTDAEQQHDHGEHLDDLATKQYNEGEHLDHLATRQDNNTMKASILITW